MNLKHEASEVVILVALVDLTRSGPIELVEWEEPMFLIQMRSN